MNSDYLEMGHAATAPRKKDARIKRVGILEDAKRGSQVVYRVRMPFVLNDFDCVQAQLNRS